METLLFSSSANILVDLIAFGFFGALPRAVSASQKARLRRPWLITPSSDSRDEDGGGVMHRATQCEAIYLDYNATTPVYPEIASAMLPYLLPEPLASNVSSYLVLDRSKGDNNSYCGTRLSPDSPRLLPPQSFGNPSSAHAFGTQSRKALDLARHEVASLLNASLDDEIIFTGCGSESDNWAVRIALDNYYAAIPANSGFDPSVLPHVVTSAIEHPAVLSYLHQLRDDGILSLSVVGVNREGFVDADDVAAALTARTCLVTIMHSNNEIGSIQPIASIAGLMRRFRGDATLPLIHTDAAQSVGKVEVDVRELDVDMLTIVGHKFGAPKGIAALFVRHGLPVKSWITGGGQEHGRRAGTESTMLIAGLGAASSIAARETITVRRAGAYLGMDEAIAAGQLLRTTADATAARIRVLELRICMLVILSNSSEGEIMFNGPSMLYEVESLQKLYMKSATDPNDLRSVLELERLAETGLLNTISISFRGVESHLLVQALGDKVACSGGSACHSGYGAVSHVLQACGVPREFAIGTLRLSLGRYLTASRARSAARAIVEAVEQFKRRR